MCGKPFVIAAAVVALAIAGIAQDNTKTHSAASAHVSTFSRSAPQSGNWASGSHAVSNPQNGTGHGDRHHGNSSGGRHKNYNNYGYNYGWGTPIELPYDSEYSQLEGRGTFDQEQPQEPADNRVGPTIFEHNGQVSGAVADSRYPTRAIQDRGEAAPSPSGDSSTEGAVLVFRDGHQQEIGNYAIAGNKLIVLGDKTQKISLSDLDLQATQKANAERGLEFKMPSAG